MKLQGMAIIYVLIIIPMLIVISLTLSGYREQLNNSLKYDSELTGAVNDAITAFELNNSSEDYSNVSDNFASIIEASVNIFRRSIATRLNMTNADESLMNRYFPLALFTGYSGYYIYSPTYSPVIVKNPNTGQAVFSSDTTKPDLLEELNGIYSPKENTNSLQYTPVLLKHKDHNNSSGTNSIKITTSKDLHKNKLAKEEIDYSLKQMIPYNVELNKDTNNKILLNFTLDNYISFTGKVKGIAYNKSGYLLNNRTEITLKKGNSTIIYNMKKLNDNLPISHLTYFDEYVDDYIERELTKGNQLITLIIKENNDTEAVNIVFNPKLYQEGLADYKSPDNNRKQMTGKYAYQKQQLDAIKYYIKAANFSNFVYKNLNTFSEADIVDINLPDDDKEYKKYFLSYNKNNKEPIFSIDKNVLDFDSNFNEIKRKVIRNSVQYDLIIATKNYNYLVSSSDFILKLPVITDTDWERIVENVSFTAFLQGLSIGGGKKYNNYSIATSTMNKFVINPDTIYFTDINGFNQGEYDTLENENNNLYYHKINCTDFLEHLTNKDPEGNKIGSGAIGFKVGEWVYDAKWSREESKYIYDHRNYSHFNCIANNNLKLFKDLTIVEKRIVNKNVKAAVAAEKERTFKTNAIVDGSGYKNYGSLNSISFSNNNIKNIKGIEIATVDKNNKEGRKYNIKINNSIIFTISNNNSISLYPSLLSGSKPYEIHKEFINELKSNKIKNWDDIKFINIYISPSEEILNTKIIYF